MDSLNQSWSAFSQWTGGLDERGFAAFGELAMALSPLRRLADETMPPRGVLHGAEGPALVGGTRDAGAERGKRW
jgi:hypothetical protein